MKKCAICVGNDAYSDGYSPLKCAVADASAMNDKLKSLGFESKLYVNVKTTEVGQVLNAIENAAKDNEVLLFYYAGHGEEVDGQNLLIPLELSATLDNAQKRHESLKISEIIDTLEKGICRTKILIMDACRSNATSRGGTVVGFAPVFAPVGTLIAFSTSPSQIAIERDGHGVYTAALLSQIDMPRIPIENMFKHVREIVHADTSGRQIPWEHTSLMGNFYFNEDRMDSALNYSDMAFVCGPTDISNASIRSLLTGLDSRVFVENNNAITRISQLGFSDVSVTNLFVLGRFVFRAAVNGSFNAQGFIDGYDNNASIPLEAKSHILNGMAYETYYDENTLRYNMDGHEGIGRKIIALLEKEQYQKSKNFIVEKLMRESGRTIYLPGSEERFEFAIECDESVNYVFGNGKNKYVVEKVKLHGENVLFDPSTEDGELCFELVDVCTKADLIRKLSNALFTFPDLVRITFNVSLEDNELIEVPRGFALRSIC